MRLLQERLDLLEKQRQRRLTSDEQARLDELLESG